MSEVSNLFKKKKNPAGQRKRLLAGSALLVVSSLVLCWNVTQLPSVELCTAGIGSGSLSQCQMSLGRITQLNYGYWAGRVTDRVGPKEQGEDAKVELITAS